MMKNSQWKKLEDSKLMAMWDCPVCENKSEVYPSFYQDNGTPVCPDCDCDMNYEGTFLLIELD